MSEPLSRRLRAGDLEAVFLPAQGMLCASLLHRGSEILRRVDDLAQAAALGNSAAIPLLHPWANRLDGFRYCAAGREVLLDPSSPLLHFDGNGLPLHGVPWSVLAWDVTAATHDRIDARLDWTQSALLAIFPFRHRVEMTVALEADALKVDTALVAGDDGPVPASFGFHPYVGLPGLRRDEWRLALPAMRRLALDSRGIPTGEDEAFPGLDAPLAGLQFDDAYAADERISMSISGGGRRVSVELLGGYRYAQVYAPMGRDFIALEPMIAETNALVSGRGLRIVPPGARFRATFRIGVDAVA